MGIAISRRDFLKTAGSAGAAGLLTACGGPFSASASAVRRSEGDVSLTISWWGDESRRAAYQEALAAFAQQYPNITVSPIFGERAGWEEAMSAKLAEGTAEDICQVRRNWLHQHPQAFLDLQTVSSYLDLSQWNPSALRTCQATDHQLAVPVSLTGRIFYWNMNSFRRAGIQQAPGTLGDLYDAGEAFELQLGHDFYPLYLDGYGRMMLVICYLESIFGRDWADPVTAALNYTSEQIAEGLDLIRNLVDQHVLMPLPTYYGISGSAHPSQTDLWRTGQLAGVFGWDFEASRYQQALDDDNRSGFTLGDEIQFGDFKGGFVQASMGLAISSTCQAPAEAALLIDFLLNGDGAVLLGPVCGIPASRSGLTAAQNAGGVDPLNQEAHQKVMDFFAFQPDPLLDSEALTGPDGLYQQVFEIMDYDGVSGAQVVDLLLDGLETAGYTPFG